ncbi:MAG TPA: alpha/beta hydrolase [Microlunatus sp.]|nr:alpha/beta hydrolase [Microlunatus sp.]
MRVFSEQVGAGGATLTGYVLDRSDELQNANIRPAVLVLPGGGYFRTSDREAEPVAMAYLAEGFNAFVLRYAVGADEPFERSLADGQAGLGWLRANAGDLGVDPDKIAVVGFSAGGHLAACLGTVTDEKPAALVLGYPVTLAEFGPPIGKTIADVAAAVSAATPPTFLFSTSGDTLVPIRNSLAFLTALADHDVPFESHIYLLGPHGISLAKPLTANGVAAFVDAAAAQWLADSVRFLQAVFGHLETTGEPETYQTLVDRRRYGLTAPVGRLLADPDAVAVIDRHVPQLAPWVRENPLVTGMGLREIAGTQPDLLPVETLVDLGDDLAGLNDR